MRLSAVRTPFVRYSFTKAAKALTPSGLPDIDYALNPYVGCAHGCTYCYARAYVKDADVVREWGAVVKIRLNLIEALMRDVRKLRPGVVGLATITDPYQPIEASQHLSRESLKILLRAGFKVDIQTKSPLVLRDIDILRRWRNHVEVGLTITTLSDDVAAIIEPGAPPPSERAKALRELSASGITTWVFLGPIIPGVNDDYDSVARVTGLAAETNSLLIYDPLRLKPQILNTLSKAIEALGLNPGAVMRKARSEGWFRAVRNVVKLSCRDKGAECIPAF